MKIIMNKTKKVIKEGIEFVVGWALLIGLIFAVLGVISIISPKPSYYCDKGVNCSAWQPRDENGRFTK